MLHDVMNQLKTMHHLDKKLQNPNNIANYNQKGPGVLIAPHITPRMAERCRTIGLPFLDTAGNAYLNEEGLFVLITGQKPDKALNKPVRTLRAFDRTGLKLVFTLLADPGLLQGTYREMAQAAGVALGTVGWILTDLREHGFLIEDQEGKRRWLDRERAIQTWATNYPLRLRDHLNRRRFRAANDAWWKNAEFEATGGWWGGEIAAAKLMGDLVPKTTTVYLPRNGRDLFLGKHRLKADPEGPVEVLDAFWELPKNNEENDWATDLVAPLLVFADLQNIGDPRTIEQAKMIHDRYLA